MSKSIDIITTNHCQLQCKFCLNSKLKGNFPVDVMTYDQFVDVVDRCIDYGFDKFDLTPNVGDIFLDKDIMNKLIYLENNQYVKRYEFVTNFLAVTPLDITQLLHTQKCECAISIYGFDIDSYIETTGVNAYVKFKDNLCILGDFCDDYNNADPFMFYMRYSKYEDFPYGVIKNRMEKMMKMGATLENAETVNRNWAGLMIDSVGEKQGICSRILSENGIYPNGDITACNCWDWKKELIIGNMNEQELSEIYSRDSIFGELLAEQFKNIYRGPCVKCDDFTPVRKYDLHHEWTKIYKIFYK